MEIFKRMILLVLLVATAIALTRGHLMKASEIQIQPKRIVVPAQGGVPITVIAHSSIPLRNCAFVLPNAQTLNFNLGHRSNKSARYSYHGRGLTAGDCGLTLNSYHPDIVALSGVIECRARRVESEAWESSLATVRVTGLTSKHLPVFDITPKKVELRKGENITISCNAKKAIDFCHFFLPGGIHLKFDLGPRSKSTPEYRYHGAGLHGGACGITLTRVTEALAGQVVCKLGKLPANGDAAWNIDAVQVRITDAAPAGRPTTVKPTARPVIAAVTTPSKPGPVPSAVTSPSTTPSKPGPVPSAVTSPSPTPAPPAPNAECGRVSRRTVNVVPLINFGEETYRGQWPWHVALYRRAQGGALTYVCGGTLIGWNTVVTAGHCVTVGNRPVNASSIVVYAGKYYLDRARDDADIQQREIQQIILHNDYNLSAGLLNDIAMLVLQTPLIAHSFVRPVCIWDSSSANISAVVDRAGIVVGWGRDETGQLTEELMMATMPVVSYETCVESNPQHFSVFTRRTTYCAGFRNGTSACNGDSGGGMFFSTRLGTEVVWYFRGVVSNSLKKENELVCDPLNYVVFTDVAQYLPWISTNRPTT